MDRNYEHLELPRTEVLLPRRKGSGRPPQRYDRRAHGQQLLGEADAVAESLEARRVNAPEGVNPKLIFKLDLHPRGNLDETQLRQLDLHVVGIDAKKAIVVFPDQASLAALRRRLAEYSGIVPDGHEYAYLASIDRISELAPEDRTGRNLQQEPLEAGEVAALDVELWHAGDTAECRRYVDEIQRFLENRDISADGRTRLRITDFYIGTSLCVLRVRVDNEALEVLLNGAPFDYVKEIDRRPQPTFDFRAIRQTALDEIESPTNSTPADIPGDLTGVVVIDSGVARQHPLLGPALGDAEVFPTSLGGPDDGDERTLGHGTAVAGIAVYGDIAACVGSHEFSPTARRFSARVTDENNEYSEDDLVESQLEKAVDYFLTNYDEARVINISLGNRFSVYADDRYQLRLATVIDDLAYRYRERNVVFVVSAGNYVYQPENTDDWIQRYPSYLLETDESRLIDPATSALALTVGGLSLGRGKDHSSDELTDRLIAGRLAWPSPFTRVGWGLAGSIKPEIVDFAGDLRFSKGRIPEFPVYAGMPTTAKEFAPPEGNLFRTVSGTSFAAPRVSNLAARLMREFPDASSNLIRALIVDSARVPTDRPPALEKCEASSDEILRLYGYGQPDYDRARWSADNNVLLLAEDDVELDSFRLFEVPPLPDAFIETRGNGHLSITLAFDPPTRHSRADSYAGVSMQFDLFRNISREQLSEALRSWSASERESLEDMEVPSLGHLAGAGQPPIRTDLRPRARRRSKGTLQRAILRVASAAWKYDKQPLKLAVTCQRKWAPSAITAQRFALVVSLYHDNPEADLYNQIRQHTRLFQRARIRV